MVGGAEILASASRSDVLPPSGQPALRAAWASPEGRVCVVPAIWGGMEMSGAAKFTAGGIFPKNNSAPSQGQACVHQKLQPEGEPRAAEWQHPTCCCGAGGGGMEMGVGGGPACAHPEQLPKGR